MKKFWEISKMPLIIGVIASVLYIIDALIGGLFVKGGSFMWVAFAVWTVFFGASLTERIRGMIGIVIGYLSAVVMMLITSSFNLNIATVSISCLLGVFVVNALVMYLNHTEKFWTNSVTGVFVGIMLVFSGLGKGLNPLTSFNEALIMFAIIIVYAVFGMICGFLSIFKKTAKTEQVVEENK